MRLFKFLKKEHLDQHLPRSQQYLLAGILALVAAVAFFPMAESNQNPARDFVALGPPIPADYIPVVPDLESATVELDATDVDAVGRGALSREAHRLDPRLWLEVKPGDSLSLVFHRAGLGPQQVADLTAGREQAKLLSSLRPGDNLVFNLSSDLRVQSLELVRTPLESWLFTRKDNGAYGLEHRLKQPEVRRVWREATINDSLFLAAQRNAISASLAMHLTAIFTGVVDFIQDTRTVDKFGVLYEELYLDNQYIGAGRILAAEYTNQGKTHLAVRYENRDGDSSFYSPTGEAMRKAFLLNPVDFTRISSGFSLARMNPILNTIRAHKGTDYAAPKGTPVVATADGHVTVAEANPSYGNLIVIKHNDRFETRYAHLNGYAAGIKAGARVKQGQVIGYVGATGNATGPHLHYEFLMDGVQRDSRRILEQQEIKQMALGKDELPRFVQQTQPLLASISAESEVVRVALLSSTASASKTSVSKSNTGKTSTGKANSAHLRQ